MNKRKLLAKILSGTKNIRFHDLVRVVEAFGFNEVRTQGSHHIFAHSQIPELINLQEEAGKAKPYQVRQFLEVVERYALEMQEDLEKDL